MNGPTDWICQDQLTLFAEDSPAKTSPLQAGEQDSQESAPVSSTTHLLSRRMSKRDGSSWKTCRDFSQQIKDAILGQSSLHWARQGFTTESGELLIRNTSESRNAAVDCSLSQVLQDRPDDRYWLSPKAAQGILTRATRRGRTLPEPLHQALTELSMR